MAAKRAAAKPKAAKRQQQEPQAGNDQIEIVYRDVRELVPYARNARQHSRPQLEALKTGLREFGYTIPILLEDDDRGIIAGHGRRIAAMEIWEAGGSIKRCPQPWMVPTITARGWTDEQKRAYVIWDNRSSEMASWDEGLLKIELEALMNDGYDIARTGFDEEDLHAIVERAELAEAELVEDAQGEWNGMPEFQNEDLRSEHRLIVHFATTEDRDKFAELVRQKITDETKYIWFPRAKRENFALKRVVSSADQGKGDGPNPPNGGGSD